MATDVRADASELGQTKLYDYQLRLLNDKSPFRIVNKARQIGISFVIALEGYWAALEKSESTEIFLSVSERHANDLLNKVRFFMNMDFMKPLVDRRDEIQLPNGSRLLSLPCKSSSARSYTCDRLYLDEVAHYQNSDDVFQAVVPSLTRSDRPRYLTLVSTPLGKGGKFFDIWDTDNDYHKHRIDIYEAIKGGCPINVAKCRTLAGDDLSFRQEYCCEFVDESTSFFPYDLIKQCWDVDLEDCGSPERFRTKTIYAGYDPAKVVDSGVFTVVERTANKVVLRHIKEWLGVPYSEQLRYIEAYCRGANITKLVTDQTGVGQKIQEDLQRSLGARAEGVTFTAPLKEKMITDLRVLFQDKNISIPYNLTLVNQLHSLARTVTESGTIRYKHEEGKHDDYVWSLAMACYGFNLEPIYEVQTVSPMARNTRNLMREYQLQDGSVY